MKTFWVRQTDKTKFIEAVRDHHISELGDPFFQLIIGSNGITFNVTKYYHYRVDISEEEYVFLKLVFDLKETL